MLQGNITCMSMLPAQLDYVWMGLSHDRAGKKAVLSGKAKSVRALLSSKFFL